MDHSDPGHLGVAEDFWSRSLDLKASFFHRFFLFSLSQVPDETMVSFSHLHLTLILGTPKSVEICTGKSCRNFRESFHLVKDDDVKVACTAVRVPTLRAHSESITVETEEGRE